MQGQGQLQGQGQFGYVAPVQETTITFKYPLQLAPVITPGLSDLSYGNGRMKIGGFPFKFNTTVKELLASERITEQLDYKANVPIKKFIGVAADLLSDYAGKGDNIRYIIVQAEANKSLQAGLNANGMGTGVGSVSGAGGGGLFGIQGGVTKAHDLYTIIIVKIVGAAKK
jgi:hypothetical protein